MSAKRALHPDSGPIQQKLSRLYRSDLVVLLALLVICSVPRVGLLLRAPAFITNDSLSYLLPGFDLATGQAFEPIFKRPPGYPLFVGGALWLFGQQDLNGLLLLQHLVGLLTFGLTFALGRALWGRPGSILAALLTGLSGPLLTTEHYLMSESLFGALLTCTVLFAARGLQTGRSAWILGAGLLLGLAALTRPVAQLLLPLLAVLPLLAWRRVGSGLRAGLLLVACYFIIVTPWMARNSLVQGNWTLAGGLGEGLAVRTIRLDQEFDFRSTTGGADALRTERQIYREEARQGSVYELARRLRDEAQLSPGEADRAMRDIALGAIGSRPSYYAFGSLDMFVRMFAGRPVRLRQDWQPWRGIVWDDRVAHLLPVATAAQERQFELAQQLVTIYDPARLPGAVATLFLIGFVAASRGANRWARLLPPLCAVSLLLASAFLVGIEWRYRYPLDPLINVTVAGGAVALIHHIRRLLSLRLSSGLGRSPG